MARYGYDYRITAVAVYNPHRVHEPPNDQRLERFTDVVWHGLDDEGYCVYKRNPWTGEIVRIDFRT